MSEPVMRKSLDELARSVAARTTRRSAVAGLSTLALGALGLAGIGQSAEAKKDHNKCNQCKRQCKQNNKKPGKKDKNKCNKKCENACQNM